MSEPAGRITYDEAREHSVLERCLLDRSLRLGTAIALVCATLSIALVLFFGFYPRPVWELAEAAAQVFGG